MVGSGSKLHRGKRQGGGGGAIDGGVGWGEG